jgi:hypothetical protein
MRVISKAGLESKENSACHRPSGSGDVGKKQKEKKQKVNKFNEIVFEYLTVPSASYSKVKLILIRAEAYYTFKVIMRYFSILGNSLCTV